MTDENKQILDIIKTSLWNEQPLETTITDSIRKELRDQAVDGLVTTTIPESKASRYYRIARFTQMVSIQSNAMEILSTAGIPAVVIKGTAAGIYYPVPYLRVYGDIDILVHPKKYQNAISELKQHGFQMQGNVGKDETTFYNGDFIVELHQSPPGLQRVNEGEYILNYLLLGLNHIEHASIAPASHKFPMLPWKQNGLELLWHIREHLYNGLGLRQIIDWMMFVHHCMLTDEAYEEFGDVLENAGLLNLAKIITKMCQMYLGLSRDIDWCKEADGQTCKRLMIYILEQGDFGHKTLDDKAVKVFTRYQTPFSFIQGMQNRGVYSWELAEKYGWIRPFAWLHTAAELAPSLFQKHTRERIRKSFSESRRRRQLFDELYGKDLNIRSKNRKQYDKRIVYKQHGQENNVKLKVQKIVEVIRKTPVRALFYHLQSLIMLCRYWLYGKPVISELDIKNTEQNVTFIYKSFNRPRQAVQLYRCIKKYYPRARVIIADDSQKPLHIDNINPEDVIIHLPFNSGLSKGLMIALERVKTPFVMRLDDDILLTPYSFIHKQLSYLQNYLEVDLVAVQMRRMGEEKPESLALKYSRFKTSKKMLIPAGTFIGGKEVIFKAPNVYLARTDKLRKVGFDPNIRMLDHHEFFFRAAGQIVCVQDRNAFVMHCHNFFYGNEYTIYRDDYSNDVLYIIKKHGSSYE